MNRNFPIAYTTYVEQELESKINDLKEGMDGVDDLPIIRLQKEVDHSISYTEDVNYLLSEADVTSRYIRYMNYLASEMENADTSSAYYYTMSNRYVDAAMRLIQANNISMSNLSLILTSLSGQVTGTINDVVYDHDAEVTKLLDDATGAVRSDALGRDSDTARVTLAKRVHALENSALQWTSHNVSFSPSAIVSEDNPTTSGGLRLIRTFTDSDTQSDPQQFLNNVQRKHHDISLGTSSVITTKPKSAKSLYTDLGKMFNFSSGEYKVRTIKANDYELKSIPVYEFWRMFEKEKVYGEVDTQCTVYTPAQKTEAEVGMGSGTVKKSFYQLNLILGMFENGQLANMKWVDMNGGSAATLGAGKDIDSYLNKGANNLSSRYVTMRLHSPAAVKIGSDSSKTFVANQTDWGAAHTGFNDIERGEYFGLWDGSKYVEYVDINLYIRDMQPEEIYISEKVTGFKLVLEALLVPTWQYKLRPGGERSINTDLTAGEILYDGVLEVILRNEVLDGTLGILELPKGAHHDFLYVYPTVSEMKQELEKIKVRQNQIVDQLTSSAPDTLHTVNSVVQTLAMPAFMLGGPVMVGLAATLSVGLQLMVIVDDVNHGVHMSEAYIMNAAMTIGTGLAMMRGAKVGMKTENEATQFALEEADGNLKRVSEEEAALLARNGETIISNGPAATELGLLDALESSISDTEAVHRGSYVKSTIYRPIKGSTGRLNEQMWAETIEGLVESGNYTEEQAHLVLEQKVTDAFSEHGVPPSISAQMLDHLRGNVIDNTAGELRGDSMNGNMPMVPLHVHPLDMHNLAPETRSIMNQMITEITDFYEGHTPGPGIHEYAVLDVDHGHVKMFHDAEVDHPTGGKDYSEGDVLHLTEKMSHETSDRDPDQHFAPSGNITTSSVPSEVSVGKSLGERVGTLADIDMSGLTKRQRLKKIKETLQKVFSSKKSKAHDQVGNDSYPATIEMQGVDNWESHDGGEYVNVDVGSETVAVNPTNGMGVKLHKFKERATEIIRKTIDGGQQMMGVRRLMTKKTTVVSGVNANHLEVPTTAGYKPKLLELTLNEGDVVMLPNSVRNRNNVNAKRITTVSGGEGHGNTIEGLDLNNGMIPYHDVLPSGIEVAKSRGSGGTEVLSEPKISLESLIKLSETAPPSASMDITAAGDGFEGLPYHRFEPGQILVNRDTTAKLVSVPQGSVIVRSGSSTQAYAFDSGVIGKMDETGNHLLDWKNEKSLVTGVGGNVEEVPLVTDDTTKMGWSYARSGSYKDHLDVFDINSVPDEKEAALIFQTRKHLGFNVEYGSVEHFDWDEAYWNHIKMDSTRMYGKVIRQDKGRYNVGTIHEMIHAKKSNYSAGNMENDRPWSGTISRPIAKSGLNKTPVKGKLSVETETISGNAKTGGAQRNFELHKIMSGDYELPNISSEGHVLEGNTHGRNIIRPVRPEADLAYGKNYSFLNSNCRTYTRDFQNALKGDPTYSAETKMSVEHLRERHAARFGKPGIKNAFFKHEAAHMDERVTRPTISSVNVMMLNTMSENMRNRIALVRDARTNIDTVHRAVGGLFNNVAIT